MQDGAIVRLAGDADLAVIRAIYEPEVRHGTATFELEPPDVAELARRLAKVKDVGLPWLVAERDGVVLGYAYATPYRERPAYRFTAEDSVYIAQEARGRGVGRRLLAAVLDRSRAAGMRQMVAIIGDSANLGSIALHRACGFRSIGTLADVGYKHGRWLDTVLMQKAL